MASHPAPTLLLLGGFQLQGAEGQDIPLTAGKAQALLAYLALHRDRNPSRDQLAALLWEDRNERQARQNLRQTLTTLRRVLPPGLLNTDSRSVSLPGALTVDVALFEAAAQSNATADLERAARLYRGDLLAGLAPGSATFEEWLTLERSRLRERALTVRVALVEHLQAKQETGRALEAALELLALDPLREASHRSLMELQLARGHPEAALQQYRACRTRLARELGVQPQAATEALRHQVCRQGREEDEPEQSSDPQIPKDFHRTAPSAARLRQSYVLVVRLILPRGEDQPPDPERHHRLLENFFAVLEGVVEKLEGSLIEHTGGEALALFGIRRTHGDDPQRSLEAVVAIRETLAGRDELAAAKTAMGLAGGRVVIGATDQCRTASAAGSVVERASALSRQARAGEVLLDESLARALEESVAAVPVAGRDYRRLLDPHPVILPAGQTELVGRQIEQHQFATLVQDCRQTGRGHVLLLRGETGIGKTRLTRAFRDQARQSGFRCHTVRMPTPEDASDRTPVRRLPSEQHHPQLVVVEDIDRADERLLDKLTGWAEATRHHPLLLVVTLDHESQDLTPVRWGGLYHLPLTTLDLGPLSRSESLALARQTAPGSEELVGHCVRRSGGNPLFLKQLLCSGQAREVPDTLRSLVWDRLDRLTDRDREALQAAAVLGRCFDLTDLRRLIGRWDYDGGELLARGLIRPWRGHYRFGYELIHQAVYESLLRSRRRELHRRVVTGRRAQS